MLDISSASAAGTARFRPPYRTPLTRVPLRLPDRARTACGGLTSRRKWCRDTLRSFGSLAWQSLPRPSRNASCRQNSKTFPLIGPDSTFNSTLLGIAPTPLPAGGPPRSRNFIGQYKAGA